MPSKPEKLLVISEMGLGDALTLLPALRSLKGIHPDVSIDMLAPGLEPLRENVRETALILDHRPLDRIPLSKKQDWLLSKKYGAVWNTENESSEWRRILDAINNPRWLSAPPHRTWPRKHVLELRLEQLCSLYPDINRIGSVSIELTRDQLRSKKAFRDRFSPDEILIAIQPGAKDKTKVWPPEKFIELSRRLIIRPMVRVLFFIGSDERDVFDKRLPDTPNILRIEEPLKSILPKLATCDLFIGNDSGFYHLAFSLGLRAVAIYRSRRNMKVWSHRSPRTRAVCFYLPSPVRRHWTKCVSVNHVLKAAVSLLPGLARRA
jgi:ADP-heptose:LPS heptosyltransferase